LIDIDVPGFRRLQLTHLVTDYNGTLAVEGKLLPGIVEAFAALAGSLEIHVITADTFGLARAELAGLLVELHITPVADQAETKLAFVASLGAEGVVAIGNGRNDRLMLEAAALGIAVIQREGAAAEALARADIVSPGIVDALDLLRQPKRLIATLRS
jgi:soluble P-type ATPase